MGWRLLDGSGVDAAPDRSASVNPSVREPASVQTEATIVTVTGALPAPARRPLRTDVTAILDSWWESAYLGGRWPRSAKDFDASVFAEFSQGAAADALDDRAVMSNALLADRTTGVVALRRSADLNVFAVHGEPLGVDVRFALVYRAVGADKRVRVTGTVSMVGSAAGRWQIFDYRVSRGAVPLPQQNQTGQGAS